ncbi:YCII-like protein [Penicillium angulare]|uniref:YCII-like protein n=1 Tax=Penicillium angulare TaxID=116970 RepID=UPI00254045A8|nr:YCII-like protein [Penicillium angulare]KAJ5286746.1 YCII-like protein [Penicillium angulare]
MFPLRFAQNSAAFVRNAQQTPTKFSRFMATTGKKKEFLCLLPDRPNPLSIRKKVKGYDDLDNLNSCWITLIQHASGHYEGIQPLIAQGQLVDGGIWEPRPYKMKTGAIFREHPEQGKEEQFEGSVVVFAAENVEEVRGIISQDIYATSGVRDLEKVQIFPYVPAVREPIFKP